MAKKSLQYLGGNGRWNIVGYVSLCFRARPPITTHHTVVSLWTAIYVSHRMATLRPMSLNKAVPARRPIKRHQLAFFCNALSGRLSGHFY